MNLILSNSSLLLNQLENSVVQASKERRNGFLVDFRPLAKNCCSQISHAGVLRTILVEPTNQDAPDVFHYIKIGTTSRPVQNSYIFLIKPSHSLVAGMNTGVVLLKTETLALVFAHEGQQMLVENMNVVGRLHFRGCELDSKLSIDANSCPNHERTTAEVLAMEVLRFFAKVSPVKSISIRTIEIKLLFITKDYLKQKKLMKTQ